MGKDEKNKSGNIEAAQGLYKALKGFHVDFTGFPLDSYES